MQYPNLHFEGQDMRSQSVARFLSRLFDGSQCTFEDRELGGEDILVFIDEKGVQNDTRLWEIFGKPKCILHLCAEGGAHETGGYKRVQTDIHQSAMEEVLKFFSENGLYQEGKFSKA